jgi:hypothetical protein
MHPGEPPTSLQSLQNIASFEETKEIRMACKQHGKIGSMKMNERLDMALAATETQSFHY